MARFLTSFLVLCLFLSASVSLFIPALIPPVQSNGIPANPVDLSFIYDGQYDFSSFLFRGGFDGQASDWPRIYGFGRAFSVDPDTKEEKILGDSKRSGRILVIPPYILVPHHIVDLWTISVPIMTPFGPQRMEKKADVVKDEDYWLLTEKDGLKIPLKKIIFLPEDDLALFETPSDIFIKSPSLPLGRSSELEVGHTIFILGSPGLLGSFVRYGIISSTHVIFPQLIIQDLRISVWLVESLIAISISAQSGDSGSIVVALRDGKPETVGIVNIAFNGLGTMVAIDRAIEKIKETTGIDLRESKKPAVL